MSNNQLQILSLELEKKKHVVDYLEKKLKRYENANIKIQNVISRDEIEDVNLQITNAKIEMQILEAKIKDLKDAS